MLGGVDTYTNDLGVGRVDGPGDERGRDRGELRRRVLSPGGLPALQREQHDIAATQDAGKRFQDDRERLAGDGGAGVRYIVRLPRRPNEGAPERPRQTHHQRHTEVREKRLSGSQDAARRAPDSLHRARAGFHLC